MPDVGCPGCGGAVGSLASSVLETGIKCLFSGACTWQRFIQLLLDPYDLWFSQFFVGRPKVGPHSATDAAALFLIPSANPVVALWGASIRGYEALGCFLSGGGPCELALRNLATAALTDLTAQFGTLGATYFSQYAYLLRQHNPDTSRVLIAAREIVDKHYSDAVAAHLIDPTTGFPFRAPQKCLPGHHLVANICRNCDYAPHENPCPPPPPQLCPQGQHFDPSSERCVADCPPGYKYVSGKCIAPPPPVCPPGYVLIGLECFKVTKGPPPPPPPHCDCSVTSKNYIGAWH